MIKCMLLLRIRVIFNKRNNFLKYYLNRIFQFEVMSRLYPHVFRAQQ